MGQFFKVVRSERGRLEKQTEEKRAECEEKAAGAVESNGEAMQAQFDVLKRKLELTTRGAKQQKAQFVKQHTQEMAALEERIGREAEERTQRMKKQLEREFALEREDAESRWAARLQSAEMAANKDNMGKVNKIARDRAQLDSKLAQCMACLREKDSELSGVQQALAAEQHAHEETKLRDENHLHVTEKQLQQSASLINEAEAERDDALAAKQDARAEMRERERAIKAEHKRDMRALRQRKQEQLDDVCSRVKRAVGQKQEENAKLVEKLEDAETRAANSEELLQQLDQGFIGAYEPDVKLSCA